MVISKKEVNNFFLKLINNYIIKNKIEVSSLYRYRLFKLVKYLIFFSNMLVLNKQLNSFQNWY